MDHKFKTIKSETVFNGPAFSILREQVYVEGGSGFERDTLKHNGAVVILPRLSPDKFIILKQYRQSVRQVIYELPAGTLKPNEDPQKCAMRELTEETGYSAENWSSLGKLLPAPGFCSEVQHLYIADNLTLGKRQLDPDEHLEAEEISLSEFEQKIRSGEIFDAKSIAFFCRARLSGLL